MIWREKQLLLAILGVLLIANLVFFFTYRVQFEERLKEIETRQEQSETRLQQARAARQTTERQVAGYRKVQRDVQDVYNNRWSTQTARLSPLIQEVKRLTVASQLVPQTISFDRTISGTKNTAADLSASTVGITFAVAGTYQQARRLINLLELSQQFVIVDRLLLTSSNEGVLTLNLHVKTLFRDPSAKAPPRTAAQT
jgi:Tfp pilus assembly protein PilO